jgi:hypothetical protein
MGRIGHKGIIITGAKVDKFGRIEKKWTILA